MRLCDKPIFEPYKCAATLRGEDVRGWIDTGIELNGTSPNRDPHIYLSFGAVETAARLIGWDNPAERDVRIAELERDLEEARAQLAEADQELNAIHILKGRGYAAAKRPGRPPSKQAA